MRYDTQMMGGRYSFQTTSWSLVRAVHNMKALEALMAAYWKPLYFFIRQQGHDNENAKDIVQEFLTTLLSKETLRKADPARGRFRTFLLAALENFMMDRVKSASRQKRGGGRKIVSLDFSSGEEEFVRQVKSGDPPETVLNRAWARGLWESALAGLQADAAHLNALRLYLDRADYKTIRAKTGLSESAARTAIHRLKVQLRETLTSQLRESGVDGGELRAEVGEFLDLLR